MREYGERGPPSKYQEDHLIAEVCAGSLALADAQQKEADLKHNQG